MWPSLSKPRSEAGTFFFLLYAPKKLACIHIDKNLAYSSLHGEGENAFETIFTCYNSKETWKLLCRFHQDLNSDNWIQVQSANH